MTFCGWCLVYWIVACFCAYVFGVLYLSILLGCLLQTACCVVFDYVDLVVRISYLVP